MLVSFARLSFSRPATLMRLHEALVKRKYRWLFAPKRRRKPGPQGPSPELVIAIVEMKRRSPRFGCRRIAQQIALLFGVEIDKDVVRRVLAKHCRPTGGSGGPSWLTFLGHAKDSLWSVDLFRCESLTLKNHWVMVVMDQFTRRIIGFAVRPRGAMVPPCAECLIRSSRVRPHCLSTSAAITTRSSSFIAGRPICASLM